MTISREELERLLIILVLLGQLFAMLAIYWRLVRLKRRLFIAIEGDPKLGPLAGGVHGRLDVMDQHFEGELRLLKQGLWGLQGRAAPDAPGSSWPRSVAPDKAQIPGKASPRVVVVDRGSDGAPTESAPP